MINKRIDICLKRIEFLTEETTYRFEIAIYAEAERPTIKMLQCVFLAEVGTSRVSFHSMVEGMPLPERSEKLNERLITLLRTYVDGCRHQQSTSWIED